MTEQKTGVWGEAPDGYYTAAAAAEALGLTIGGIEARVKRGYLATHRVMVPAALIPASEIERAKREPVAVGRRAEPEPDRYDDPDAWQRWHGNQERNRKARVRRAERKGKHASVRGAPTPPR